MAFFGVRRLGAAFLAVCLALFLSAAHAADAKPSEYRGWKTLLLDNGLVQLHAAPDIGGRVIQFKLGGFEYLWVNEQLGGKTSPPSGVGPKGEWLNYGGDKLWPAPQGWEREDQWPGPPDPVLDGSPHTGTLETAAGDAAAIKLVSQPDKRSGVQFSRVVKLCGGTHVSFDSTMKNIDSKPRRWGIWQVTQHNAAARQGAGFEPELWTYCPANPKSLYPRGYQETFGLVNNPSFSVDARHNLVRTHYLRRVGKIGLDCAAGWLAVVNGTAGYVFVERFAYHPDKKYPDQASVEFWMNGAGEFVLPEKEVVTAKDDPVETPSLIESEVLSPFAELQPGESYTFHLDWYAARIGGNFPVLDCTDVGVSCAEFQAKAAGNQVSFSGRFGVFYPGTLGVVFLDANDKTVGKAALKMSATPLEPLVLTNAEADLPGGAVKLSLVLAAPDGKELGFLATARVK
ncbi:MAG: DUF4380 domain-containing protein [Planctomycetota bacterium]